VATPGAESAVYDCLVYSAVWMFASVMQEHQLA